MRFYTVFAQDSDGEWEEIDVLARDRRDAHRQASEELRCEYEGAWTIKAIRPSGIYALR